MSSKTTNLPTPALTFPAQIRDPADIETVERMARVVTTPCGEGHVVWHVWNEKPGGLADGEVPVVLLHGGSGSWNHWVRNIAALVHAGHTVYAPDIPGFGHSSPLPDGKDADAVPPYLETGLEVLLGARACKLVGFSFGGLVAGFLAASFPARVERLVLVGAPALSAEPLPRLPLRAWNHLPASQERDAIIRRNLLTLMVADERTLDATAFDMLLANLLLDRLPVRRLARTAALLEKLPDVTCPVYGIWGARDALYSGHEHVIEAALRGAPAFQSLRLLEGAGHWVQYEKPAEFDEVLVQALA